MYKLNLNDAWKGLVTAVIAAIVVVLWGVIGQPDFDVFSTDWSVVFSQSLNAAIASFLGYIIKNFFSNNEGDVLGAKVAPPSQQE